MVLYYLDRDDSPILLLHYKLSRLEVWRVGRVLTVYKLELICYQSTNSAGALELGPLNPASP